MKIFNTPKRFDCFPIPLENSWAWDSHYWEYVVDELIPSLNQEELELARLSIINQISRINKLLIFGAIPENEKSFKQLPLYEQLLHPLEQLLIAIDKLENNAIRSKENLLGMEKILNNLRLQIEATKETYSLLGKDPSNCTCQQDLHTIQEAIKHQIREISKQLFTENTKT